MEKSISDYDQSLVELEKQREQLELVMKKMGQEWEESGAGIAWMNTLDLAAAAATGAESSPSTVATPNDPSQLQSVPSLADPYPTPLSPDSNKVSSPVATTKPRHPPLLDDLLMQPASGPSPEYLQSLLNVNEALLAQSLSTTSTAYPPPSSSIDATFVSPPTTPEDQVATQKKLNNSGAVAASTTESEETQQRQ